MARNAALAQSRDDQLRQDYAQLKAQTFPLKWRGQAFNIQLKPEQVHQLLGAKYHLSVRRIEDLLYPLSPVPKSGKTATIVAPSGARVIT